MSTDLATRNSNGTQDARTQQIAELSTDTIIQQLCPKATKHEAFLFLQLCKAHGLNPFLREAYLIKYSEGQPASMVVGKDAFTRRAEEHPMFDGFKAGVLVLFGDAISEREGAFTPPNAKLIGGWAEVYRKDRAHPFRAEVALDEYETGQSGWKRMKATMIRKVALVQALREAFTASFAGLYDAAEMPHVPVDTRTGEIITGEYSEVPYTPDPPAKAASSAAPASTQRRTFSNVGELFTACKQEFGIDRSEVLRLNGVSTVQLLNDWTQAYQTVAAHHAQEAA